MYIFMQILELTFLITEKNLLVSTFASEFEKHPDILMIQFFLTIKQI